jgi:signal transduction histidine kinase
VLVRARSARDTLELAVIDDGVGFGGAASSGTGVGLVNVRRQLAARYAGRARLALTAVQPRGACARITLPAAANRSPLPDAQAA